MIVVGLLLGVLLLLGLALLFLVLLGNWLIRKAAELRYQGKDGYLIRTDSPNSPFPM